MLTSKGSIVSVGTRFDQISALVVKEVFTRLENAPWSRAALSQVQNGMLNEKIFIIRPFNLKTLWPLRKFEKGHTFVHI